MRWQSRGYSGSSLLLAIVSAALTFLAMPVLADSKLTGAMMAPIYGFVSGDASVSLATLNASPTRAGCVGPLGAHGPTPRLGGYLPSRAACARMWANVIPNGDDGRTSAAHNTATAAFWG